ncbi:TRAP transporter small permease [Spiribacter halobius]|uniref:TRAP transporter small permease protein n=1 Tax=Sediminicurvatus halobius TaxID=2182432 RepID=A0A2U2N1S0_9GAMM|nr:TRAP transporter small permease [Spiribacter halobius]PWG62929.1 TRAP transporter small permease [Spiribacter halobius]UEX77440.1 TRAP transporter small permease [Spiribacter halobius]
MRIVLDGLYRLAGVLAALCMAGIALVVLAQIAGRGLGFRVPEANEIAGYLVAGSAFLGLAPTLQAGTHIRVNLALQVLPPALRRWVEVWCLLLALAVVGYATWWALDLVIGSFEFDDRSPGELAIPLWIPQCALPLGLGMCAVALLDNLQAALRGQPPAYVEAESAADLPGWNR